MNIQLSDHFDYKKLLRFTFPSIVMMIFTSIYGVVDGFFVSNFVGKTPFAAVNLIYPFLMIMAAGGFMFGTGGGALIAKTMGEGDMEKANSDFSFFVYLSFVIGVILAVIGICNLRSVATFLGAEGVMLEDCVTYGRIILMAVPFFMLQMEFQSFFITAEKPKLGLAATVAAGISNIVLDFVLIAVLDLGLVGAAMATASSQVVGGVLPLLYFIPKNSSLLRLGKCRFDGLSLLKACSNGSSELLNNISMSLVNMLYNFQLIRYAGEDGVAAYGVLLYVNMVFIAVFIGYSIGSSPIIGYHYGAEHHDELKGLLRKSLCIIAAASVAMAASGLLLSMPLSRAFVGYDEALYTMTVRGFKIYSCSFLFAGFAIFGSGFFTALNDGLTSAAISFLRTLVFQIASVLLLPLIFGMDGIWWSIVFAEAMAVVVSGIFLVKKRKQFHY